MDESKMESKLGFSLYDVNDFEHRYERLLRLLSLAYLVCKYIDSTDDYGYWPDSIREHVADAYSELYKFRGEYPS